MAGIRGSRSPPRVSPGSDRRGSLPRSLSGAVRSTSPPRAAPDPDQAPRILQHGGCSAFPAGPSVELAPLLLRQDSGSSGPLLDPVATERPSPFTSDGTEPPPAPRIKSIVVAPPLGCRHSSSGTEPGWTEVSARRGGRHLLDPSVPRACRVPQRSARLQTFIAGTSPPLLYLFRGRCFRCLRKRNRLAECRDPIHCITYRRAGHIAKNFPRNPLVRGRGGQVRGRLGPAPPKQPLHQRIRFPPPAVSTMSQLSPVMLRHLDHACRPRATRSVAVPSPTVDQAIFFLRSHAITLTAADGVNATSPMAVGRTLEGLLSVPVHSLRVTAHHPEHFLVLFTQPAHQVNALRRGSTCVEGASFNIASWHEHDHAIFDSLHLHVRVVIEMVPMQFWSVEGAEEILGKRVRVDRLDSRTLERGHTKTFSCWIWTSDIANIPTSHTIAVLSRGAGRVEEMEGFSPPDSRVEPPPATADYTMLIHVDRIEDWTTPSPRSCHSGQSGLPSSGSDDDSAPFPLVAPATWSMGVEDGRGPGCNQRQARVPVADLCCCGRPSGGHAQDQDGDGRSGGGSQRSWRDVLLRRGRSQAPPKAAPAPRHRSRSPQPRRRSGDSSGRRQGAERASSRARPQPHQPRARPPPPPPSVRRNAPMAIASSEAAGPDAGRTGKDPMEDFFKTVPKPYNTSAAVDSLAADVHATAEAVVNSPLEFDAALLLNDPSEAVQLDAFSPTLSAAASDMGQYNRTTPTTACTMELQLGAVTGRVSKMQLGAATDRPEARGLFCASKQTLISAAPAPATARRQAAPPKSRASSTPTRHNARQAASGSTVPVAQRASLRLVKELGLLGPRDKMTDEVARALL
ncbi:D-3-phosphoglycerate dehydrogenase, chloroplastic [Hordeum vulgare]|nr:D-3-phosphoglycerate dehydrogenase, chloroplastic [Hordeum vulgare]